MYLDRDDRRPTLSPQLALRIAILGGVALVGFAIIFFRLWYLQVLEGDRYRADANDNRVREVKILAPRGQIVDRDGRVLVDNRPSWAVVVTPDRLPHRQDAKTALYNRLGKLLHEKPIEIRTTVREQLRAVPFSAATVKLDVPDEVRDYLLENQENFRGITVEKQSLRQYPYRQLGAHLFGTVGEVNAKQLKDKRRYRGVTQGDRVGQSGIEYSYDRYLRGENGATRLKVDALGKLRGTFGTTDPKSGRQLRLTIDLDVQRAGQKALAGRRGAFVVMNIKDGEMLGLGSSPSFDPNIFSKGIKQKDLDMLQSKENGAPLSNRATQGLYPTGSTFKLITSVAALQGGLITPGTTVVDGGCIRVGEIDRCNAGKAVHGAVDLRRALTVSSDVYFYKLGMQANSAGDGLLLQKWANRLGLGKKTGIDLPAEGIGLVPSPAWRNKLFKKGDTDRPWSVGDNVNLAIGQGDLYADPLQMAVAYAAVGNGGYVVRPRLGLRIDDAEGGPLQEFESPRPRRLTIDPQYRQAIMEGLRGAASAPGGTSTPVFKGFPVPVAGKTGTAQIPFKEDQSWYVALWPYPNPRYVVAVTIEEGGFGAEAAAPAARKIIAAAEDVRDRKPVVEGGAPD